jgi:medium-chain acyl-[acyl-carrier-protein] hydrolase
MGIDNPRSPWIVCRRPNPEAAVNLFCFPYAGGGASMFSKWSDELDGAIRLNAVQLPGHETRIGEAPVCDLPSLLDELSEIVRPFLDAPFALLGHSMGALIGFELARLIRKKYGREPVRIFLSGLRALQLCDPDPPLHLIPGPQFLEELQLRYGLPAQLLADPELLQLFLPLLQADFRLCESYTYSADTALDCPISVFGGLDDRKVCREAQACWQAHSTRPLKLRMLEGDHYFFETAWRQLVRFVVEDLRETNIPESSWLLP